MPSMRTILVVIVLIALYNLAKTKIAFLSFLP